MSKIESAMIEANNAMRKYTIDVRSKKLCHYTSPDGLLGIFSQEVPSLYFSQYDSLNDTKERQDIFECLKKYCAKQLKSDLMSRQLYEDILSIPQSDLFGITRKTEEELILDSGEIVKDINRSIFKVQQIEQAIYKQKHGYQVIVNAAVTDFWDKYITYKEEHYVCA